VYRGPSEDLVANFQERVVGVMRLQAATFEEVEHDASATSQAAIVVLAATIAQRLSLYDLGVGWLLGSIVTALVAWLVGALVLFFIGTRVLPGRNTSADVGQLLRTVGFAQAPGIFGILVFLPVLGGLISLLVFIWVLAATVIAVRQALDYDDTLRAVIVCLLAAVAWVAVVMVASMLGLGARVW
jgi:hypothetical protein